MIIDLKQKETRQLGVAGAFSEKEGDHERAISYYMEAGLPGKAAKVMLRNSQLTSNAQLMSQVRVKHFSIFELSQ